jgi:DNA-binding GntR family transcriptional regulator
MPDQPGGSRRLTRATLTEQVQDALRLDIIEGVFAPGQRLRPIELSDRYKVSATPLREALQRLAAQSLVEIDPRMGVSVAQISQGDLYDIYWLRGILEALALERAIERGDGDWEEQLRTAHATLEAQGEDDPIAWSATHRGFHEALFAACRSPWLLRVLNTLYDHSERYRLVTVQKGTEDAVREHNDIYAAAIERDKTAALAALRRHIQGTVQLIESGATAR